MFLSISYGGANMWVWKDSNGTVREFVPIGHSKRCPICGQFFKKGEKACVIVPPMEIRIKNKKLSQNLIVHYNEWVEFCNGVSTNEELANKFCKHRIPKQQSFTTEQNNNINAFIKASSEAGFRKEIKKPYGVKMLRVGSSLYLEYNIFTDKIEINHRGKRGLFDSFYEQQIVANVYNKMHEIIGDGKKDNYSCAKEIQKLNQEVNETMKHFF